MRPPLLIFANNQCVNISRVKIAKSFEIYVRILEKYEINFDDFAYNAMIVG